MTKSELNPCHVITTMNKLLFRTLEKENTVCLNLKEEAQKNNTNTMNYYPIYDEQLYDFNLTIFVLLPLANEYTIQPCFLTNKTKLCSSWHIANPLKMNEGFMNTEYFR